MSFNGASRAFGPFLLKKTKNSTYKTGFPLLPTPARPVGGGRTNLWGEMKVETARVFLIGGGYAEEELFNEDTWIFTPTFLVHMLAKIKMQRHLISPKHTDLIPTPLRPGKAAKTSTRQHAKQSKIKLGI
jgi:hypothetical protein